MKHLLATFAFTFLLISFSNAQTYSLATENNDTSNDLNTTMEFEETEFEFGTVPEGDKVSYIFRFENTGDKPLIIKNAKGSCGCTVPNWPKEPIAPGKTGEIKVEFNTKGKSGNQSKRVTITANTNPAQTYLTVKGQVDKKVDKTTTTESSPFLPIPPKVETPSKKENHIAKDCFAIFPNPTTDVLKIELKEYFGKTANIKIVNASGKLLNSRVVNKITQDIIEFQVNDYSAGTYYVNIQIGNEMISTKCFVVAKN